MRSLLILLVFLPAAAMSGTCRFTTECFEAEACAETEFTLDIEMAEAATQIVQLVTDAETMTGEGQMLDQGGFLFQGGNANGAHLLTAAPDGAARYSVHYFEGPMIVTYHGTCEEIG
ncbi:hypothetical protein SAMN05421759_12140 [Roseivivax lentus]|uniref:Uncharacterized protein n=1 Tax=Roseivivax lentus TaxID=633194 RepID=A0A1N7PX12_9RHOB|nr:hypothetical protein [Roseivivax lentus]SIT14979.1 hypothetical protein SAMN05421759_12140 [Roseivivax lentus]